MLPDSSESKYMCPSHEMSWARIPRFQRTPLWEMLSTEQLGILFFILLSANDFEKQIFVEGKIRILQPGQMIVSQDNLALNTNSTRAKVRTAFKKLVALKIIAIEITNDNHTIISVLEPYFVNVRANSTNKSANLKPSNNQPPTNGQPDKRILNNQEEIKKEKEEKLLFSVCDLELAHLLRNYVLKNKPNRKIRNSVEHWAADIFRMRKADNRDPETLRRVIEWSQNDSFWWKNTVSPDSLRRNFDKLETDMEEIHAKQK